MCNPYCRMTLERQIDNAEAALNKAAEYQWEDVNQAPFILGTVEGHLKYLIDATRRYLEDSDVG
jgi:hypothetical protein